MGCSKGDSLLFHRILKTIYKVYLSLKKNHHNKHQLNSMIVMSRIELCDEVTKITKFCKSATKIGK